MLASVSGIKLFCSVNLGKKIAYYLIDYVFVYSNEQEVSIYMTHLLSNSAKYKMYNRSLFIIINDFSCKYSSTNYRLRLCGL